VLTLYAKLTQVRKTSLSEFQNTMFFAAALTHAWYFLFLPRQRLPLM
jgi:hypothetical protein